MSAAKPESAYFVLTEGSFIPDTIEDTDRLQLTKPAFELLLEKHRVVSRLPGLMRQQMQPSRQIEYDPETHKPTHIRTLPLAPPW